MEENYNLLRYHRVRSFASKLLREKDIPLEKLIRNEQNTILPAPYFFAFYDHELVKLLYVSPGVEKLYGISRDTLYDDNEHLLFDVILEDEKPAVVEFVKSIWDDHYRRGKEYISDRVFMAEYRVETLSGDILHIMHQNEVFTFTENELPKTVIARFIDMSWLFGEKPEQVVKFYTYNRQENEIEYCVEEQVSEYLFAKLTAREEEIQELINHGSTSRQIAEELGISIETVKTHRKNIKAKQAHA